MGLDKIQQTKDILAFALAMGSAIQKALADGKVSLSEMPSFIMPLCSLPAALQGIGEVPTELEHLDDVGKQEIYDYVKQNFQIENQKIEAAVLDGLKIAGDIHAFAKNYF